jgi:hypothetical protein
VNFGSTTHVLLKQEGKNLIYLDDLYISSSPLPNLLVEDLLSEYCSHHDLLKLQLQLQSRMYQISSGFSETVKIIFVSPFFKRVILFVLDI